jgi:hypothetical protein
MLQVRSSKFVKMPCTVQGEAMPHGGVRSMHLWVHIHVDRSAGNRLPGYVV